jgi:hypothetical protein
MNPLERQLYTLWVIELILGAHLIDDHGAHVVAGPWRTCSCMHEYVDDIMDALYDSASPAIAN